MEAWYRTIEARYQTVKDEEVYIVEVTIPCKKSNEHLEQRRQGKIKKYEPLLQEDDLTQVQCVKGRVIPIVMGALGTITEDTNKDLHILQMQK